MTITVPAMKGTQGGREYYEAVIALSELPRLFTAFPIGDISPEEREQRAISKPRINKIAAYMIENAEGYVFPGLTAAFQGDGISWVSSDLSENLGVLEMDLTKMSFIIHDGQHRIFGIEAGLALNPDLGTDNIPVQFFPYEDIERSQQIFSDINKNAVVTPKPLNVLFNRRDVPSQVTLEVSKQVSVFQDMTNFEKTSLATKSTGLITLWALYNANLEFLQAQPTPLVLAADMTTALVDFWETVAKYIPDWQKVKDGNLTSEDFRKNQISTHATILRAIGAVGGYLYATEPKHWKSKLAALKTVDWNKTNKVWTGSVYSGNSVQSSRQARLAAKVILRKHLGIAETAEMQHEDAVAEVVLEAPKKVSRKTATMKRRNVEAAPATRNRKALAA